LHLLFNLVWIRLHQVASQIVDGASIPLKPKVMDFVQSSFLSDPRVSMVLRLADELMADIAKDVYECTRYDVGGEN